MKRDAVLELYFRNRSSALLVAALPVAVWALRGAPPSHGWDALGLTLALAGVALRLSSVRQIGRGARVHKAHATSGLVSQGPYRWTRNPLYVAAALMLCGLGLLAGGGPAAFLLLLGTVVAYTPVIVHEQAALRELLGVDYVGYSERTPMWVGLRSLLALTRRGDQESAPWPWGEVFRREWRLVPGMLLGCAGVRLLRAQSWVSSQLDEPTLWLGVAATLAVGALANGIFLSRKRRRRAALREALQAAAAGSEAASGVAAQGSPEPQG